MTTRSASVASEKPPAAGDGGKAAPSELIGEVTSLLRSLRAPQPAIRAIIAKVTYEGYWIQGLRTSYVHRCLRKSGREQERQLCKRQRVNASCAKLRVGSY